MDCGLWARANKLCLRVQRALLRPFVPQYHIMKTMIHFLSQFLVHNHQLSTTVKDNKT